MSVVPTDGGIEQKKQMGRPSEALGEGQRQVMGRPEEPTRGLHKLRRSVRESREPRIDAQYFDKTAQMIETEKIPFSDSRRLDMLRLMDAAKGLLSSQKLEALLGRVGPPGMRERGIYDFAGSLHRLLAKMRSLDKKHRLQGESGNIRDRIRVEDPVAIASVDAEASRLIRMYTPLQVTAMARYLQGNPPPKEAIAEHWYGTTYPSGPLSWLSGNTKGKVERRIQNNFGAEPQRGLAVSRDLQENYVTGADYLRRTNQLENFFVEEPQTTTA